MAYKQDSTFSFNNNNNNNNNDDRYRNLYSVPIPETSDEAEVDEVSEEVPYVAITYTAFGVDTEDEDDDDDFTMPNTVEEYDEPDQDAIALEYAPLANGAGPNDPIDDD